MRRWAVPLLLAAGLSLIAYAIFSEESDEEKIRAVLTNLEDTLRVEGSSNLVLRKTQLDDDFEDIFEDDVSISIPELTSADQGRSHLSTLATRSSAYFGELDVEFSDIQIDAGNLAANVQATGTLTAARRRGHIERTERSVLFRFNRSDGDWRIASVRVEPGEVQ